MCVEFCRLAYPSALESIRQVACEAIRVHSLGYVQHLPPFSPPSIPCFQISHHLGSWTLNLPARIQAPSGDRIGGLLKVIISRLFPAACFHAEFSRPMDSTRLCLPLPSHALRLCRRSSSSSPAVSARQSLDWHGISTLPRDIPFSKTPRLPRGFMPKDMGSAAYSPVAR